MTPRRTAAILVSDGDPLGDSLSSAQHVQAFLAIPYLLMGASHIVQPAMWRTYFTRLHGEGTSGLVTRTFTLELWPALLIVVFHQVWTGPALAITLIGHALLVKIVISLLVPSVGLRSLRMAERGDAGFRVGGVVLMALGLLCLYLRVPGRV
jgi:hypothetical protein